MQQRVGFGRRFAALIVDTVLILILSLPFGKPIGGLLEAIGVPLGSIDTSAGAVGTMLYYFWGLAVIYLLIEVLVGATPGKMFLGLKVAGEDGGKASWGRRFGRYAGKASFLLIVPPLGMTENMAVIVVCFLLAAVSFLGSFLIFGPRKQTLYDRLTATAVFRPGAARPAA